MHLIFHVNILFNVIENLECMFRYVIIRTVTDADRTGGQVNMSGEGKISCLESRMDRVDPTIVSILIEQ